MNGSIILGQFNNCLSQVILQLYCFIDFLIDAAEMNFYLDSQELCIFPLSRLDNIPHCKLELEKMRFLLKKDNNYNTVLAVYSNKFRVKHYK